MTLRHTSPHAKQRWGVLLAIVATFTLVLGAMVVNAASLTGSTFEIDQDADLIVDDGGIDWLTGGSGTNFRTGVVVKADADSGTSDNSFGQGSKEDTAVPSVVSGSIPPNKSDLKNFGVYTESNANGDFLNLFWTRVQDPSGTTNMDFEFNHNACVAGATGNVCSANGVTPVRTEGDLLIQYDLSQGGTTATITKREWTGSAWSNAVPLGSNALGTINTTAIPANQAGVDPALGSLSPRTFGEASINLTSLFEEGECEAFGSAYLKSRSSDTFNSALKDFIAPAAVNITNCGSITIIKDADPNALQDFAYTTTGTGLSAFSLDDDAGVTNASTTLSNTRVFNGLTAGSYSVTETDVNGWSLGSISCTGTGWAVDGTDASKVNITLAAKQNITCTFTNNEDTFKVLVLTCSADGALVNSSLELDDATTGSTGTTADTTLGVTEAQICALTNFNGVTAGQHKVDVGVNTP
jgi:hypothetical protein